jgi:hypothetical protein
MKTSTILLAQSLVALTFFSMLMQPLFAWLGVRVDGSQIATAALPIAAFLIGGWLHSLFGTQVYRS